MIDYTGLPAALRNGAQLYIERGIEPGSFLRAVLSNDLTKACARADSENRSKLFDIVSWLRNNAPENAWGSPEAVERWQEHQGARRLENWQDRIASNGRENEHSAGRF